ncbi:MAG: winged helix-turn-helix domain-containing protein [Chloroflexales bacterium]
MREKRFTLTRSQRDDLERRDKQTPERRISERIQAILLLDAGHNREQVARILHVNAKTITRWVQIFVRSGMDILCTLQSGGNDSILTPTQQQQLTAWLDSTVRSTKEAIAWVEITFQVSYTESGMRKLLQRMGYRYKQPAPVPAKADPEAQAAWLTSYAEKRGP